MALDLTKNDLSAKAEIGYEFELKLPDSEEDSGAFVTVRGAESKSVKAYQRLKFKEYQARNNAAKKRNKDVDDFSIDEAEELAVEAAVGRIKDWTGISESGKDVPFTKENATRILTEHSWIREQIMEASNDLINFQGN